MAPCNGSSNRQGRFNPARRHHGGPMGSDQYAPDLSVTPHITGTEEWVHQQIVRWFR
jgi:hypothetical protein